MNVLRPTARRFQDRSLRNFAVAVAFATATLATSPVQAEGTQTPTGTITMEGRGSVSVAPDMAVITARVVSAAKTAPEALAKNTENISKVIDTIKAAGIEAKDIQTSGFAIYPQYERLTGNTNRQPNIIGYEVRNGVEVNIRNLAKLGPLLSTVVESGANSVDGVRFQVSDPDEKLDEARAAAVQAAKHKADIFTKAAGVELGSILTIAETNVHMPQPMMMRAEAMMMKGADAAVPIEAGEETISASVTISWTLK